MISKSIYYIRLVSFIIYLILAILLLPSVFKGGMEGFFFLLVLFLYIIINIFSILTRKKIYQRTISYNMVMIALTIYLLIVYLRTVSDARLVATGLYTLNTNYCKMNFIILGLVMIGIMLNTIVLYLADERSEKIV